MAQNNRDAGLREHIRTVLTRLALLKERQRAQDQRRRSRLLDTSVEVDRDQDGPRLINDVERPS